METDVVIEIDDDEPRVEVPAQALALALGTENCPHKQDTVCAECCDDSYDILYNCLYPINLEPPDGQ